MHALIDMAIGRSRTTLLILAMVVIAGIASDSAIPVESEPHIEVPFFVVTIPHEGISPEDAERLLVMPMETEMRSDRRHQGADVVSRAKAPARCSSSSTPTTTSTQASIDVRDAVDRAKPKLPSTAEEPIVQEQNDQRLSDHPDQPARRRRAGTRAVQRRRSAARRHRSDSRSARRPTLNGQREEVLEAVIDPTALESYQISNEQLVDEHRQQQPSDCRPARSTPAKVASR